MLGKSLGKRYDAWCMLFGICERMLRTSNFWHTYVQWFYGNCHTLKWHLRYTRQKNYGSHMITHVPNMWTAAHALISSRSRLKSVGPRMVPWRTLALTGYCCENFPSKTTWSCPLLKKDEIWPNIWTIKTINSVRYNCQKICTWSRRPKTIMEIRKKISFL